MDYGYLGSYCIPGVSYSVWHIVDIKQIFAK